MTPEYLDTLSKEDRDLYNEYLLVLDTIIQESIEAHKEPGHQCPSFYDCHNRDVEGFKASLKEHLTNPEELNAFRKHGIIGLDAISEAVRNRERYTFKEVMARLIAIERYRKEVMKAN